MHTRLWRTWKRLALFSQIVWRRYEPDMAPIDIRTAWEVACIVWDERSLSHGH